MKSTALVALGIALAAALTLVSPALAHEASATITRTGDGNAEVAIEASGLEANSSHANHIHGGTCDSPEGIVATLNVLTADGDGDATATTSVTETDGGTPLTYEDIANGEHIIVIHRGTNLDDPVEHERIACGAIPAANGAESLTVELEEVEDGDHMDEHVDTMPSTGSGGLLGQRESHGVPWLLLALVLAGAGFAGVGLGLARRRVSG